MARNLGLEDGVVYKVVVKVQRLDEDNNPIGSAWTEVSGAYETEGAARWRLNSLRNWYAYQASRTWGRSPNIFEGKIVKGVITWKEES